MRCTTLAIAILVALSVMVPGCHCDTATDDAKAIRETIRGYVDAYNAEDYQRCLSYLTGWGPSYSEDDAVELIRMARERYGEYTIEKIEDIAISGSTATAIVTLSWEKPDDKGKYTNSPGQKVNFRKDAGTWKYLI